MSQTEVSPRRPVPGPPSPSPPSPSAAPHPHPPHPPPHPQHQQLAFQEAVRAGNTAAVQALLQGLSGCELNVNSFGPEGQTALHQSVIEGNLELVKLLVKFGADVRLANRDGWSALHIAAFGGHQDIVLYLVTRARYAQGGAAGAAPSAASSSSSAPAVVSGAMAANGGAALR